MTALSALVENCPADKRDQLAALVAEHLATGVKSLGDGDVELLNTVLENTFSHLAHPTRKVISDKLASCDRVSSGLAMLMASDEVSIAARVLEESPALSDDDLLELARKKGQGHLKAISQRDVLNRELTNLLLSLGDAEVREFVISNLGADIAPEDFERLASELPGKMGNKISHLRKSNETLVQDLLRSQADIAVGPDLAERETRIPLPDWIATLRVGAAHLDQVLTQLCLDKNLLAVASVIAEVSGFPEHRVGHLMIRFDATGLAILCKTLGVDDLAYSTLCRVRCAHMRLPVSTGNLWAANYSRLDARDATRLLNLLVMKLEARQDPVVPERDLRRLSS